VNWEKTGLAQTQVYQMRKEKEEFDGSYFHLPYSNLFLML